MWNKTRDTLKYLKKFVQAKEKKKGDGQRNTKKSAKKVRTNFENAQQIKDEALKDGYKGPICPFCESVSVIKTAKEYTGREEKYCYWVCPTCDNTSVTTRKNSYRESGELANAETRRFRSEVQKLLINKKEQLNYNHEELNLWIQVTADVPKEKAWVGRLTNEELSRIAKESQKELFNEKYGYIFDKVQKTYN